MLVKVSKKYFGKFGVRNEHTNSIEMKDSTSAPFEFDDALASFHIRNGVLVEADSKEDEAMVMQENASPAEPVPDRPSEEQAEEQIDDDIPDGIPEELPEIPGEAMSPEGDDLDSISDYKVLKEMAKEAGINPFGKNKDELRAAIRESREA